MDEYAQTTLHACSLRVESVLVRLINNARRRLHDHRGERHVRQSRDKARRREARDLLDAASLELILEGVDHRDLCAGLGRLLDLRDHHVDRQGDERAASTTEQRGDDLLLRRGLRVWVAALEQELLGLDREEEARTPVGHTLKREDHGAFHKRRRALVVNHLHADLQRHLRRLPRRHTLSEDRVRHHARLQQQRRAEHETLKATTNTTGDDLACVLPQRPTVHKGLDGLLGQRVRPREDSTLCEALHDAPREEAVPDTSNALARDDLTRERGVGLARPRLLHDLDELEVVAQRELIADRDTGADDELDARTLHSLLRGAQRERMQRDEGLLALGRGRRHEGEEHLQTVRSAWRWESEWMSE